jgi:hypothetical protein
MSLLLSRWIRDSERDAVARQTALESMERCEKRIRAASSRPGA